MDDDYWVWNSDKSGYEPVDTEWWHWDPEDRVMRPVPHEGWRYDPFDGRGRWKRMSEDAVAL